MLTVRLFTNVVLSLLVLQNWSDRSNLLVGAYTTDKNGDQDHLEPFALLSLSVVDVNTGEEIVSNLADGDTACLSATHPSSKSLTVIAITTRDSNGTIAFNWDYGDIVRVESRGPYALAGAQTQHKQHPTYHAAKSLTVPGDHILTVRASSRTLSFPSSSSTCINKSQSELSNLFDDQEEAMKCTSAKGVTEITIHVTVGECFSTKKSYNTESQGTTTLNRKSPSNSGLPSRLISARNVVEIRGELKQWQKVTLLFNGPIGSERGGTMPIPHGTRAPNLFADYLFQMEFRHDATGTALSIPGHFAADGHAATTGAVSGHVWACHFRPPLSGVWQYTAQFKYGVDIARSDLRHDSAMTAYFFDGHSGVLHISGSGPEQFIATFQRSQNTSISCYNERLSQNSESGAISSATSHIFDSMDFDGYDECRTDKDSRALQDRNVHFDESTIIRENDTPNHPYSWGQRSKRPKGQNSMTLIQSMATQNVTHMILPMLIQSTNSFITPFVCQSAAAKRETDDRPALLSPHPPLSNTCGATNTGGIIASSDFSEVIETDKTRIDVSKTEQWSRILDWATEEMGMTLQLQLDDESLAKVLDNGDSLGPQRKLYYREVVSRFGHYRDLIWDMGSTRTHERQQYLASIDPYHHLVL